MRKPSDKNAPPKKKSPIFFAAILLCAVCFIGLLTGCEEQAPEIENLEPRIGRLGEVLTIRGNGFGDERNESFITIAGTSPTSSSYLSWSDEEISVQIPEFGEAGLVYVHRGRTRSNPALFANESTLPKPALDSQTVPVISSVEPASGPVGSLITILGSNFGSSRGNSGVFFSWNAESPGVEIQSNSNLSNLIEAFENEFGYEHWSEREIRVRLPDGAVSGNLEVRTQKGNSRPVFFEITGRPGIKTFKDKKSYLISFSADFRIERSSLPNILYVWMPRPVLSSSQRSVELISSSVEPYVENYRGSSLFQLIDTHAGTNFEIKLFYEADVYTVETAIRNNNPVRLNRPLPLGTVMVRPTPLIPSENTAIREQLRTIIGNERLPYPRALRIYNWLISAIKIEAEPLTGGARDVLEEKKADSYSASLLFCALARAADIPAQPVAGVLINRYMETTEHYWAEFWLDGFGWIPLDPALGAGAAPSDFNLRQGHAEYYFGNLDNQRVAFSRGEHSISRMTPRGQITLREREYSLQNIWEEAIGGLAYSSLWSNVTITDKHLE